MPHSPNVSPAATAMTLQVCSYNAVTDTATVVFDLNDHTTTWLHNKSLKIAMPKELETRSGNMRAQGEIIPALQYQNRHIQMKVMVLGATSAAVEASVAALVNAVKSDALPYCLALAWPGMSVYRYADVVRCVYDPPTDPQEIQGKICRNISLDFECRPGLRGDRITLSNLVMNPGFEGPMGGGVATGAIGVFSDTFANVNAYGLVTGSGGSVSANVLTVFANSSVSFGSLAWGAVQTWQLRFTFATGLTANFYLHYTDANNSIFAEASATTFAIFHRVAGTNHLIATGAVTLTNGTSYWMTLTQFPSVPGSPPYLTGNFYTDSAGNVGALALTISGAAFDAVTAMTGRMVIEAGGAAMAVGGVTHTNPVQYVGLFGPGAWTFSSSGTGLASGVWDGSAAGAPTSANTNCYPNGPATSFGCARIDAAPAGTFNAQWLAANNAGTASIQQTAQPIAAAGNVIGVSAWVKSSGVGAGCTQQLLVNEFDSTGTFLRQGTVSGASVTGAQAAWTQLSGTYTTGASCAYVTLILSAVDGTTGSVSGSVWWDNVQVYNQTTTGQTSMAYHELRSPNSPAQLMVSGIQGDIPTPCAVALGTYFPASAPFTTNSTMQLLLGRRQYVSANGRLIGAANGWYSTGLSPQSTAVLDVASYGGWYAQATVTSSGWSPRAFSQTPADSRGVYHVYSRFQTSQSTGNIANVQTRPGVIQRLNPWYGTLAATDDLGEQVGTLWAALSAGSVWTVADAGQVILPPFAQGAAADPALTYLTPRAQWVDNTGGGSTCLLNWEMLLPIDASLIMGTVINPSNSPYTTFSSEWLISYLDGNAIETGGSSSWMWNAAASAIPAPTTAGGGSGTTGSGPINVNSGADSFPTLDPTSNVNGVAVNQFAATYVYGATVQAVVAEITYAPLYLTLR